MSLPISAEEHHAKVREGVIALSLLQRDGPRLLEEGFMDAGDSTSEGSGGEPGQGAQALDHLRDVLHDLAEQHGMEALYCVYCGGLVSSAEHTIEEVEEEAHLDCASEHGS